MIPWSFQDYDATTLGGNTSSYFQTQIDSKLNRDQTTPQITTGTFHFDRIQFSTSATPATNAEGLLQWNSTDGTLDLGMQGGNIAMQIGQELFIKVRNNTSGTLINGKAVYFTGRLGNRPTIDYADGSSTCTCNAVGLLTEDILTNEDGYVTTYGYVRGIKTDYAGWAMGDKLYISTSTPGDLTNIEPQAPYNSDVIATVGIVHQNLGSILVGINRNNKLEELSDVNGTPLTTNGQFPVWNNTDKYFDFTGNYNTLTSSITINQIDIANIPHTTYTWTADQYWTHPSTFSSTLDILSTATVMGRLGIGRSVPEYRVDAITPDTNHLRTLQSGIWDNFSSYMSGYAIPAPSVVSAKDEVNASRVAWMGFDNNLASMWISATIPSWLKYDFGAGNTRKVTRYAVVAKDTIYNSDNYNPKNWTFEASNDNTNWVIIDTQTNVSTWGLSERRYYTLNNDTAYRYYRINISSVQTTADMRFCQIVEMNLQTPYGTGIDVTSSDTSFGQKTSSYTFKTNNEYISITGDVSAQRGSINAAKELRMAMTRDTYGGVNLSLRNRVNQIGLVLGTPSDYGYDLVDLIFEMQNTANFRTLRLENRTGYTFSGAPEFQLGIPGNPTLIVHDDLTFIKNGNFGVGISTPNSSVEIYGSFSKRVSTTSVSITLSATQSTLNCTGTITITLPTAVNISGREYSIKNVGTGTVTLATTSSQLIDGELTQSIYTHENLVVQSDGIGWYIK